jgi:phage shock protein PspC (stress-responsive transcriptional regulator)
VSCFLHTDRDTTAKCGACRQSICQECDVLLGGRHFCKKCLAEAPTVTTPPAAPATPVPEGPKSVWRGGRLMKSRSDRVIFGVFGGLGNYFGIDPALLRIGFVALMFSGYLAIPLARYSDDGTAWGVSWNTVAVLFYIVAAMSMPSERKPRIADRPEEAAVQNEVRS